MKFEPTGLDGVIRVVPTIHRDARGYFLETWQSRRFADGGIDAEFVQENYSYSSRERCAAFTIKSIARRASWSGSSKARYSTLPSTCDDRHRRLAAGSAKSSQQKTGTSVWVPEGFGHGFLVLSDTAGFEYSCTDYYSPEHERHIRWNDPDIGIEWPLPDGDAPRLSDKDANAPMLKDAETYP